MRDAYINFIKSAKLLKEFTKLSQEQEDSQLKSPDIIIEPTEPVIDKAVKLLKRMDPSYFVGTRKIVVSTSSDFGHVESGPGKDPAIININTSKIKQTSGSDAVISAALVIAHEKGHVKSFNPQQGFVGGESPAQAEEQRVHQWIQNNMNRIQDLLS